MIRLAVLAPIQTSLYSRLVAHLAACEPGVELAGVLVRTPWTAGRIVAELRRDGARLLWKVYRKMVLGKNAYGDSDETIRALAQRVDLPGRTLRDLAAVHHFPLAVVKDHNNPAAQGLLREWRPDAVAFTGGGLVRRAVLDIPRIGVINCHLGLLPRYRGMDVVEWPVLEHTNGEPPAVGLTVHLMDPGVDTGPVLLQRRLDLRPGDTFASIRTRIEPLMVKMMLKAIRGLRDGTLSPAAQRVDDGRQYFVLHPRMYAYAESRLRGLAESSARRGRKSVARDDGVRN